MQIDRTVAISRITDQFSKIHGGRFGTDFAECLVDSLLVLGVLSEAEPPAPSIPRAAPFVPEVKPPAAAEPAAAPASPGGTPVGPIVGTDENNAQAATQAVSAEPMTGEAAANPGAAPA